MQRLYIDVDGVLLTKRLPEKAQGADLFIDFVTRNFECFWLTTHCKGNSLTAINYLKKYMGAHTMDLVTRLKPK